jgi:hypothetical protein
MQGIWKDLELSDVAQEQQLADITERALGVWNGAVDHAEQHRAGIRARIDEAASEMRTIAELLGELNAIEDPNSSVVRIHLQHTLCSHHSCAVKVCCCVHPCGAQLRMALDVLLAAVPSACLLQVRSHPRPQLRAVPCRTRCSSALARRSSDNLMR